MPRKKSGKHQTTMPGTDTDRHKDIDAQADVLRDATAERKAAKNTEDIEKDKLKTLMLKHGLKSYSLLDADPPQEVVIEAMHEEVKIRRAKPAKDDDAGDLD